MVYFIPLEQAWMNIHYTSTSQDPKFTMPQTAWIDFVRELLDKCRHVSDWKITNAAGDKFLVDQAKALYESLEQKQYENNVAYGELCEENMAGQPCAPDAQALFAAKPSLD